MAGINKTVSDKCCSKQGPGTVFVGEGTKEGFLEEVASEKKQI